MRTKQKDLEDIVNQYVFVNQTLLVTKLFSKNMFDESQCLNYYVYCINSITGHTLELEEKEYARHRDEIHELVYKIPLSKVRNALSKRFSIEAEEQTLIESDFDTKEDREYALRVRLEEEYMDYINSLVPDRQIVYEWWVVSDLLLGFLMAEKEPILRNDYGSWWGRTTTGQSISMDEVIKRIYNKLNWRRPKTLEA